MFSATKLVAAAAVVSLSGALLLAGPFTTQPAEEPVAPTANTNDPNAVVLVSGQMSDWSQRDAGKSESHDWGYSITDRLWTAEFDLSDERLSGPANFRGNVSVQYWDLQGALSVYIGNDGGSWVGTGRSYLDPASTGGTPGSGLHSHLVLRGQDGYEGLSAIVAIDQAASDQPYQVSGAITPLALPSTPGPASTSFGSDEG